MLARVVENVYWLSRYMERAENTARIINVNAHLLLDLPKGIAPGWLPLVDISGNRAEFDEKGTKTEERDVVQFLVADPENPGSLFSSLRMARENARTLREILPTEAWEMLNEFHSEFVRELPTGLTKRMRFKFLNEVVGTLQKISGVLDGTMSRNASHTFLKLGRNLERTDMTSRIVDVRSAQLLPAATPELRPFETVQWMSVLKSLSAYQMYRGAVRSRVRRTDVLEFLLRNRQFPRACMFCLDQVELDLKTLQRGDPVVDRLDAVRRFVAKAPLEALDQSALHEFIDQLQLHISDVHDVIARTFFPTPHVSGVQRLSQQQGQTQKQSRLAF